MSKTTPFRIIPAIMSGGAGARLWPLSTDARPKQFHALNGPRTLFAQTLARLKGGSGGLEFETPIVLCGASHADLVSDELRGEEATLVIEPAARNTAAVAAVAAALAAERDPEALVLLAPADHLIADVEAFHDTLRRAAPFAAERIVTFGMAPDRPATGYGYIRRGDVLGPGVFTIAAFKEKPDHITALGMAHDDQFSWNSGMFLFSPRVLLEEFAPASDIRDTALEALRTSKRDGSRIVLGAAYTHAPTAPLDTVVMEKTQRAAVAPCDIGWADIGAWDEIWRHAKLDDDGNATRGEVIALNAKNSVLHAEGVKLCVSGIENLIVIATKDAVIVLPRDRAQDVKQLKELAEKSSAPAVG